MPEGEPQGLGTDDLLLCTYKSEDSEGNLSFGTITNDPKSSNDVLHPGSIDDLSNVLSAGASPKYWNGYVFKSVSDYTNGTCAVHAYKIVNGQEIEVGQLPEVMGNNLDIVSHDSGLVIGDDGNFYRLVATGDTVVTELVGDIPSLPGPIEASYGGYMFVEGCLPGSPKDDQLAILSEDDPTAIASIVTTSTGGTSFNSSGVDVDGQTGELVVATQNGFKTAQLPQLDQNGKLPVDFSLTELTFSGKIEFKPGQQVNVMKVIASNGYKYFKVSGGKELIIATPDNQIYVLDKTQLGVAADCPPGSGCITGLLKLESDGIYVIFNDDMNLAPVSLVPTSDPAKFMPSGAPFEKIIDEPVATTKHIINNGCSVVTGDKSMFQPLPDPCAEDETLCDDANACTTDSCTNDNSQAVCDNVPNVGQTCDDQVPCTTNDKCNVNGDCAGAPKTCPEPAEQCKQSAGCDANTGSCLVKNEADGTICNDGNPSTENDQCLSGACQGTPVVNPEPEPEADVVEQAEEQAEEIIAEVIEANPEANPEQEEITADTGDATEDTTEDSAEDQTGDNDNTTTDATTEATPEATPEANPETPPELDTHDLLYVEGEDVTADTTENIQAEINVETKEVIAEEDTQGKSPGGCGCTTMGRSPNNMDGTLLLGAMLIGLAARFRNRVGTALMKRR